MAIRDEVVIPQPQPARKVPGYEMPEDRDKLLSWDFVAEKMSQAEYYWLSLVNSRNGPHAVPMWCIWHNNRIHFDGSPKTGWAQNLMQNPQIAVHLPDAEKVVILYGNAYIIEDDELSEEEWDVLDSTYQTKYGVDEGSPYWYVEPTKVLAWNGGNLHTMTRWIFK